MQCQVMIPTSQELQQQDHAQDHAQESVIHKRFDVSHTMDRLKDTFVGQTLLFHDDTKEQIMTVLEKDNFHDDDQNKEDESTLLLNHHHRHLHLVLDDEQHYLNVQDECAATQEDQCDGYSSICCWNKKLCHGNRLREFVYNTAHQIPAVALIAVFHLMIGVPFGVSYFPIGWRENFVSGDEQQDEVVTSNGSINGPFPVVGKDALGIRMFLFSTIIGQIVLSFTSGFGNPISLQMIENVPFCQALAQIVIAKEGYGMKSLSTIMFLFGLSSVLVGMVFFLLGKFQLGKIIYFFPSHVLVGCIAGIGLFITKTAVEVTIDRALSFESLMDSTPLFSVVIFYECFLRILEQWNTRGGSKPRFALLSPIYFCMITPTFYAGLKIFKVSIERAEALGYFFPPLDPDEYDDSSPFKLHQILNGDILNMWKIVDLRNISWVAVMDCIPTIFALSLFSLIHVPINIPAFSISTNQDIDMNQELLAHGYANIVSGLLGGLQNYMAYTQSVLYARSGGWGKCSGVAVAFVTTLLFVLGPMVASYVPRCMAGTLLLHVGIDLFLEGVYDTFGKFERLEYAGIWLIAIVMTIYGMNAAMIAGGISAVSTYAVQTIAYLHPIRGSMTAVTLRSSKRNRNQGANAILDDYTVGRRRILVIQLQGHLFFGNMAQLNESITKIISEKQNEGIAPWVIIMDFSLVVGIDSSAAQAITKLKKIMNQKFGIQLCIFVTGSNDGFPCEYNLSSELTNRMTVMRDVSNTSSTLQYQSYGDDFSNEETALLAKREIMVCTEDEYSGSHVTQSLDLALVIAENAIIYKQDPLLLQDNITVPTTTELCPEKEIELGVKYLQNICPGKVATKDIIFLFSKFKRLYYQKGDIIWLQDSPSDCAILLINGCLVANLEDEAGTSEIVQVGRMIGELGLVQGNPRMSTVRCLSEEAVAYKLDKEAFQEMIKENPASARLIDLICITYLSNRVQHVSNRIFETRCLPI